VGRLRFFYTLSTPPQVTGATAGCSLQPAPELHPASIGSGPLHAGGTTPPPTASRANNYLSSKNTLLQPPGDDRRLQQKVALTTRRTTTSTTTITLTSNKHSTSGYKSAPRFSTKLPQLAILHPAVASRGLKSTYNSIHQLGARPELG
jgi:hypothetical protein